MPRGDYSYCRNCNGHVSEVGTLSHTRLCAKCGVEIENETALQIHAQSGPRFQHWARRSLMAMHRKLLDDTRASA